MAWHLQFLIILSQFVKQEEHEEEKKRKDRTGRMKSEPNEMFETLKQSGRSHKLRCFIKVRLGSECKFALNNFQNQRQATWPSHDNVFLDSSLNLHLY